MYMYFKPVLAVASSCLENGTTLILSMRNCVIYCVLLTEDEILDDDFSDDDEVTDDVTEQREDNSTDMYYGNKEEDDECELEPAHLAFNEPSDTEETELDKQELLMVSVIRLVLRHFLPCNYVLFCTILFIKVSQQILKFGAFYIDLH